MKAHDWVREVEEPPHVETVHGGAEGEASPLGNENGERKEGGEQQGLKNQEEKEDSRSVEVC